MAVEHSMRTDTCQEFVDPGIHTMEAWQQVELARREYRRIGEDDVGARETFDRLVQRVQKRCNHALGLQLNESLENSPMYERVVAPDEQCRGCGLAFKDWPRGKIWPGGVRT